VLVFVLVVMAFLEGQDEQRRDLDVFKLAHQFALRIYSVTKNGNHASLKRLELSAAVERLERMEREPR
jgi:hypothetical protein